MKHSLEQLRAYIDANPPQYHFCNGKSMVEMLYYSYTESNPIDHQKIRIGLGVLHRYLKDLTQEEEEIVFDAVCDLCSVYEYQSFVEGVRAGATLMAELYRSESQSKGTA